MVKNEKPNLLYLFILALVINVLWTISYPLSQILMRTISPLLLSCLRLSIALVCLAPFIKKNEIPKDINKRDIFNLLGMGIFACGLPIYLQYLGTAKTLTANVSLIIGLETITVAVAAAFFLKERLRGLHYFSIVLGFCGLAIITVDPNTLNFIDSKFLVGNILVFLSIIAFAFYSIFGKFLAGRWGVTAITLITFAIADVLLLTIFFMQEPQNLSQLANIDLRGWANIGYIGVLATAAGYMGWNYLLQRLSARQVAFSLYLQPVLGPIFSYLILQELFTVNYFVGGFFVLLAMVIEQKASFGKIVSEA